MKFGAALTEVQDQSKMMRRPSWNGKGMYVYQEDMVKNVVHDTERVYPPCLVMLTAAGEHQMGWFASQSDMNATDWETSHDFSSQAS